MILKTGYESNTMKKTLFLTSLLALVLTACSKEPPSSAGKKPEAPAAQGSKTVPIDPKAAAPIATDEQTPPIDPKTGAPASGGKP